MRKFLISIISIFIGFSAYCAGKNIPTSKSYVDSALVPKQDIIDRTTGNPKVLTNTGTAGEYETKDIYDSTASYGGQSDALIDAVTMNTAVQNAIDSEFQCVEYNPNDPTDCWLMDIRGATDKPSGKNLFDINNLKIIRKSKPKVTVDKISNGLTVTFVGETSSSDYEYAMFEFGNINDFLGKTLSLSTKNNCINGGLPRILMLLCNDNCSVTRKVAISGGIIPQQPEAGFTKIVLVLYATSSGAGTNPACTYTDIQVEEGSVATAYEPYKNLYLPSGN